jgi:hypothetical protein
VRRIAVVLNRPAGAMSRLDVSHIVQDALAGLPPAERHALALSLLPVFSGRDLLTASAYEALAELAVPVVEFALGGQKTMQVHRSRATHWDRILATVSRLEKTNAPLTTDTGNLLYALFAATEEPFNPDRVAEKFQAWRQLFAGHAFKEAA